MAWQSCSSKFKVNDNCYQERFKEAISDDLNTARGLAVLWEMLKDEAVDEGQKLALVLDFDRVLGLGLADLSSEQADVNPASMQGKIPEKIKKLAKERKLARMNKDFVRADKLRQRIQEAGFEVRDTGDESVIKTL